MMNSKANTLHTCVGKLSGVHIENIDLNIDFLELASRFAELPGTVVLLSGGDLDCARYHILGALPWLTLTAGSQQTLVTIDNQDLIIPGNPFTLLRQMMEILALPEGKWPAPLTAGLLGYFSYDLKDCLEQLPRTTVDDLKLPDMLLYAHSLLVVHDKETKTTQLMIPKRETASAYPDTAFWVAEFYRIATAKRTERTSLASDKVELSSNFSQKSYEEAVQKVREYIRAGDVYQVNLSQRFQVPFTGDSFNLFRNLYQQNPAPFFAYIQAGDHQIVSTSPERFLQRKGSKVEARPIKGTMPRGWDPEEDQAMQTALANSEKDDAELSMIVDLLRNDIGKVCAPFSVRVTRHKRMEAYQNVYHQVSIVEGVLDADKNSVDLIEAAFPGGSITGCPKIRAMEIIDELESHRRHLYCGSIGYLSFHDTMDLSIAIRTATIVRNSLYFSVGGGIVIDSVPRLEYEETLHKGKNLIEACQGGRTHSHWQQG
jgi:para-aminobenzoate synthetase component 1